MIWIKMDIAWHPFQQALDRRSSSTAANRVKNWFVFSTHRRFIAAVFASVCLRFFKYLFWYFCNSAIDPVSACILLGEMVSPLLLLIFCCWWIVATDDSESLEALDESDKESGCCCWLNLIRETLIFGDGVNEDEVVAAVAAVVDGSLLLLLLLFKLLILHEVLLLLLLLLLPLPALKFIRLSFCTLCLTK